MTAIHIVFVVGILATSVILIAILGFRELVKPCTAAALNMALLPMTAPLHPHPPQSVLSRPSSKPPPSPPAIAISYRPMSGSRLDGMAMSAAWLREVTEAAYWAKRKKYDRVKPKYVGGL
jgi:hypothetical protein